MERKFKFKLFTNDQGEPEVKLGIPGSVDGSMTFWREDGKLSFLEIMASDPDHPLTKLADGVYQEPK